MKIHNTTIIPKGTMKDWVTEEEIRNLTGFKSTKLWQLRKHGKIVFSKVGRRTFYLLPSLLDLIENNKKHQYEL